MYEVEIGTDRVHTGFDFDTRKQAEAYAKKQAAKVEEWVVYEITRRVVAGGIGTKKIHGPRLGPPDGILRD